MGRSDLLESMRIKANYHILTGGIIEYTKRGATYYRIPTSRGSSKKWLFHWFLYYLGTRFGETDRVLFEKMIS